MLHMFPSSVFGVLCSGVDFWLGFRDWWWWLFFYETFILSLLKSIAIQISLYSVCPLSFHILNENREAIPSLRIHYCLSSAQSLNSLAHHLRRNQVDQITYSVRTKQHRSDTHSLPWLHNGVQLARLLQEGLECKGRPQGCLPEWGSGSTKGVVSLTAEPVLGELGQSERRSKGERTKGIPKVAISQLSIPTHYVCACMCPSKGRADQCFPNSQNLATC